MDKTTLQSRPDKYLCWGRRFRLILGWFEIVLAFYLLGFSVYLLVTGKTDQLPQVAAAVVVTLPAGFLLVRSKPGNDQKRTPEGFLRG